MTLIFSSSNRHPTGRTKGKQRGKLALILGWKGKSEGERISDGNAASLLITLNYDVSVKRGSTTREANGGSAWTGTG